MIITAINNPDRIFSYFLLLLFCGLTYIYTEEDNENGSVSESIVKQSKYLKLIVFDTDKTIWPFSTDYENVVPPLKKEQSDLIIDGQGNHLKPYPQTLKVFQKIKKMGIKIGVVAQSPICKIIYQLLDLFDFGLLVDYRACFVGPRKDLLRKMQQVSGISCNETLYLDDEYDEAVEIMDLNVTALLCEDEGAMWYDVERGLELFELEAKYVPDTSA